MGGLSMGAPYSLCINQANILSKPKCVLRFISCLENTMSKNRLVSYFVWNYEFRARTQGQVSM